MTGVGIAALLAFAMRTLIVLVTLTLAVRVIGKRQAGEMRTIDILVILIVANAVQNAMTKSDGHLVVSLTSAGTLILAGWVGGAVLRRTPSLEQRLSGAPVVLVRHGHVLQRNVRHQGLTDHDLMVAARKQGITDLTDAQLAVLEMDGSISVIPAQRTRQE